MLNEVYDGSECKLTGKPYQAVKLGIPHIKFNETKSLFRIWLYRKIAFIRGLLLKIGVQYDPKKGSVWSIKDYIDKGAKILFVYREKEDNIRSMMKRSKYSRKVAEKSYRYAMIVKDLIEGNQNVFVISLKHLTSHPEMALRQICSFLGLQFEKQMLDSAGYNNTYNKNKIERKQ